VYTKFIDYWRNRVGGYVQYRFSGGDPMVLGKRLFTLADRGYQSLGLKPFMLTAGKALAPRWAEQARKHAISHVFVSVENPFDPDVLNFSLTGVTPSNSNAEKKTEPSRGSD
jgi:hypothetical protein